MSAPKRLKTEESAVAGDTSMSRGWQPVASLALLSCQVVEKALIDEQNSITDEANASIAKRKEKLERKMTELYDEREVYIEKREKELADKRAQVLEHTKAVGGSDSYCTECDMFYKSQSREDNPCSVESCTKHSSCPVCYDGYDGDDGDDWDVKSDNSDEYESCWYEQNGNYDSTTGYANCWICKKELCDQHFERHYEKCRSMVSKR